MTTAIPPEDPAARYAEELARAQGNLTVGVAAGALAAGATFQPMDALFYGIAGFEGFRLAKMPATARPSAPGASGIPAA